MKDTIEKNIFDSCGKLIIDTEKMKKSNDLQFKILTE